MIRLVALLLMVWLLSGCVAVGLIPLAGFSGLQGGLLTGAGSAIGGAITRSEIEWYKQLRKCQRRYPEHWQRQACMDRWRRTRR